MRPACATFSSVESNIIGGPNVLRYKWEFASRPADQGCRSQSNTCVILSAGFKIGTAINADEAQLIVDALNAKEAK